MSKLKPCPFCGYQPTIEPWHGGAPTKRMIACDNERCHVMPQVTGANERLAIGYWNKRHITPGLQA